MNFMRVNWCGFKSLMLKTDLDTNVKIVFCFLFFHLRKMEKREWGEMLSISHGWMCVCVCAAKRRTWKNEFKKLEERGAGECYVKTIWTFFSSILSNDL